MLLSTLLHKKPLARVATAIPAISATEPPKREAATVARIATVAIANPSSEKQEKITPEIINKPLANVATAIPATFATGKRVKCCDCKHFERDKIGSGLGIGDCLAGQAEHQVTLLWAGLERRCGEWASSDLTGSYQV